MENREIIEEFKNNLKYGFNISDKAAEIAIQAIGELEQYKELGTPEQVREAVETHKRFYRNIFAPDEEKLFEAIENALGFKLYFWQKTFLATGYYRQIGQTTAECLRALLITKRPIDYSEPARNAREDCERMQMNEIQAKLQAAGIATNPILRSRKEKADYMREKYMHEKQFENSLFEAERKRAENEQRRFIT